MQYFCTAPYTNVSYFVPLNSSALGHLFESPSKRSSSTWCMRHSYGETLVQVQMQEHSITAYLTTPSAGVQ
jgi:hypothetical protein